MRKARILTHVLPLILIITALLATRSGAAAALLNGATCTLNWWTVNGGGTTFAEGSGYTLGATAGQPDAGHLQGNGYTLNGGFWVGTAATYRLYLPLILGKTEESETGDADEHISTGGLPPGRYYIQVENSKACQAGRAARRKFPRSFA